MRPLRFIARDCRFFMRSRMAWIILTAVVVADSLAWSSQYRPREPAGLIPAIVQAMSSRARACVLYSPAVEVFVMPADASGKRVFADGTDGLVPIIDADYVVRGHLRTYERGLWAPCVRYDTARLESFDPVSGIAPPPGIEAAALNWYAAQTPPAGFAAQQARTVARLRSGATISTPLWPGIIHDAVMLPLALLWLGVTGVVIRRKIASIRHTSRAERRRARGLCGRCAYDLSGGGHACCPECGSSLEPDVGWRPAPAVRRDLLVATRRDPSLGNEP